MPVCLYVILICLKSVSLYDITDLVFYGQVDFSRISPFLFMCYMDIVNSAVIDNFCWHTVDSACQGIMHVSTITTSNVCHFLTWHVILHYQSILLDEYASSFHCYCISWTIFQHTTLFAYDQSLPICSYATVCHPITV